MDWLLGHNLLKFKNVQEQNACNVLKALLLAQGEGGPGRRRDLAVQAVTDKLYVSPALETVSWANESGYPAYLYVHRTRVGKKSRILPWYPKPSNAAVPF